MSSAIATLGRKIEYSEGTIVIAPSMLITIRIDSSCAISAWKRRLETTQGMIPPTMQVAVKLPAIPVVRTARWTASSMSAVSATSWRMRSTM